MLVPIVGLTNLLSALGGAQSSNLTAGTAAASTTHPRHGQADAAKLDFLIQQLEQLSATNTASAGASGAPVNTSAANARGNAGSLGAVGATVNVANIEATLNQLLQNLRVSGSSTNAAAGTVAAAQSSGLQHLLLDRMRQLAQQGSPQVSIGRMLSAVA
jgi:hypothetical protein